VGPPKRSRSSGERSLKRVESIDRAAQCCAPAVLRRRRASKQGTDRFHKRGLGDNRLGRGAVQASPVLTGQPSRVLLVRMRFIAARRDEALAEMRCNHARVTASILN
jgi:hypothetical protein